MYMDHLACFNEFLDDQLFQPFEASLRIVLNSFRRNVLITHKPYNNGKTIRVKAFERINRFQPCFDGK